MTIRLLLTLLAAMIGLAACSKTEEPAPLPSPNEETRRNIDGGEIIGFTTANGAHAWRAIPFAAPPIGDLRWRAPQAPQAWTGTRDATAFAPRCAQMSNRLNESEGIEPGTVLGSEDCLYLNVYAPADATGKTLPVMVWIHGGGNVWGRASNYDGSRLANNEDVIIVTVQYRVGPFGFFSNPEVRASAETPEDAAANFAILDLIAGLEWVRSNIDVFGGDADNITIFGESAGGHNVVSLLASPLAAGLFEKAIIQSGSFDSFTTEDSETAGGANNNSADIAAELNVSTAADWRALSVEEILNAYWLKDLEYIDLPTIIEDGVALPDYPLRDAFALTDSFNAVPIITGTNLDELKFFNFARPDLVKKKFFLFPVPRDPDYYDAMNDYMARVWRIRSIDQPASLMASAGHEAVYGYRFDWDESGKLIFTDFSQLIGAGHAMEIPFVFNRFELFGERYDKVFFPEENADSREALSRAMGSYWASFARNSIPQAVNAPDWPQWSTNGGSLLRLDSSTDGGIEVLAEFDTIDALIADLKTDPRLDDDQRCMVAIEIGGWVKDLGEDISNALACAQL